MCRSAACVEPCVPASFGVVGVQGACDATHASYPGLMGGDAGDGLESRMPPLACPVESPAWRIQASRGARRGGYRAAHAADSRLQSTRTARPGYDAEFHGAGEGALLEQGC